MKKILMGLTWLGSCVACVVLSWCARGVALDKRMKEHQEIFNHWQERMRSETVSPGDVVISQFDMMGNDVQCLFLNANDKRVMANIMTSSKGPCIKYVTFYGGYSGKPVFWADFYTNGLVKGVKVCREGQRLRDWGFTDDGILEYQTVYTNNMGSRKYYAPDGTATGSVTMAIQHT